MGIVSQGFSFGITLGLLAMGIGHIKAKEHKGIKYDTTAGIVTYIDSKDRVVHWLQGYEVTTLDMVGSIHVQFLDSNMRPLEYKGLELIK